MAFVAFPNSALMESQIYNTVDDPMGYYKELQGRASRRMQSDASGSSDSPTDYGFLEYLEGLFASQGAENEINRLFNSAEAKVNRDFQSNEARIQREWYESMSNSAYQRAVADMKKAGINPILAYQQGGAASSGTGVAAGSAAAYTATGGDSLSSLLSSVADLIYSIKGSSASKVNQILSIVSRMR